MMAASQYVRGVLRRWGLDVRRCAVNWRGEVVDPQVRAELTADDDKIIRSAGACTMTSTENLTALIDAVRYLARGRIPGAVVECGVWRGGSMMAAALTLGQEHDTGRDLFLFDTYQGLPEPTEHDKDARGRSAADLIRQNPDSASPTGTWCYASLAEVQANMGTTGYPADRVHYVEGKVETTIPYPGLTDIALLRLDTDLYEPTRHTLTELFPLLTVGGVLILDDYGDWQGAKKATDEYFGQHPESPVLLMRAHRGVRLAVKCQPAGNTIGGCVTDATQA
jgi:O-methyltransferase